MKAPLGFQASGHCDSREVLVFDEQTRSSSPKRGPGCPTRVFSHAAHPPPKAIYPGPRGCSLLTCRSACRLLSARPLASARHRERAKGEPGPGGAASLPLPPQEDSATWGGDRLEQEASPREALPTTQRRSPPSSRSRE